ncbi:MAG: crotonase/enoyl-CoA hydratase family protein [Gammaproteobacteria bacterium]|nr:crotonase/enoyl-CoA hydratase family protein [Gammaproteobacteria bacterium]
MLELDTLLLSLDERGVARLELNRPAKANAADGLVWKELGQAFAWLDATPAARVGILGGRGKHFCAGIDLAFLAALKAEVLPLPDGHRQERLRAIIGGLQGAVSAIERCRKPVIVAIQGACLGGAIDIVTACDLRYATREARFAVKEIDLAIVADLGTLQRLPRLVGEGRARELALTGREFDGEEAFAMGLVSAIYTTTSALDEAVDAVAAGLAAKSPLALRGTKEVLNYSRDHDVVAGLAEVAARNASLLLAPDVEEAIAAQLERRPARYPD